MALAVDEELLVQSSRLTFGAGLHGAIWECSYRMGLGIGD